MMADLPRLSVADLVDGAVCRPFLDPAGGISEPFLVVDLDDIGDTPIEAALPYARSHDAVLVGVATGPLSPAAAKLAETLDVTVVPSGVPGLTEDDGTRYGAAGRECVGVPDPEERLRVLREAVTRNPQAALVLARVLKVTESMPVSAALDVESFAYSTLLGGGEFRRWMASRTPRPLPPPAADPVLVERTGARLLVTLNKPERRNAYGRDLRDALVEALQLAVLDDTITQVVLNGAGPSFCSGGDLDEFGTAPDLTTAHFVRTRAGAGPIVHELAARIEVHVHGACVGAGIEMSAFAGAVIADPGTTFRLPEVSMGLIPGAGGTVSIPRRIGRWRTLYLALTGEPIDAATALTWGLVDEVAPR